MILFYFSMLICFCGLAAACFGLSSAVIRDYQKTDEFFWRFTMASSALALSVIGLTSLFLSWHLAGSIYSLAGW